MLMCPFMSGPVPITGTYDQPDSKIEGAPCLEQNCALWVGVTIVEVDKPIGTEYGCSFKMLVMKIEGAIQI